MTTENTPKSGAGPLAAGGTALALVVIVLGWWLTRDGDTQVGDTPTAQAEAPSEAMADSTPEAPQAETSGTAPETISDTAAEGGAAPITPRFDVVRVEPDGSAVIAGQAAPGSDVQLMVDGQVVGTAQSDQSGNFVALLTLPPSDVPRVMSLLVDGAQVQSSDESVIIAPVQVADANVATEESTPGAETTAEAQDDSPEAVPAQDAEQGTTKTDSAPQVLLADQDGIKVLQDADGGADAAQVSLDSISYDPGGAVVIAGRAAAKAGLRAYLDNAPVAEAQVGDDGQWRMALPQIAPGVYTLRVDALDPAGKVISRVETPFKREDPAQLAALSAEGGAVGADPIEAAETAPEGADVVTLAGDDAAGESVAAQNSEQPVEPTAEQAFDAVTDEAPAEAAQDAVAEVDTSDASVPDAPTADALTADVLASDVPASDVPAPDPVTTEQAAEGTPPMQTTAEAAPFTSEAIPPRPTIVTVQPGATLWAIARDNLGDGVMYVQVFNANRDKIRNPDLIYPGQVFTVPAAN